MTTNDRYDYIVVGAGSTGCVVAARLSEDPAIRVLLLEAGPEDTKPEIHDPAKVFQLWGSEVDWKYFTEEEPGLNGRKILSNRGKVMGGSGSIHAMIYIRGNRLDYDHWNYLGNEGWSFDDVLPYFKKSENYAGGASEFHGSGGPLAVTDLPSPTPVAQVFLAAARELGFKGGREWDFNGREHENGAGFYQFNITQDGKRHSGTAFINPILERPNLTITTEAQAHRLLFEGKQVVGVEYDQAGTRRQVLANREVIVSAGAFDSPKLLMLSGIGPAQHLAAQSIPVVVDLPGVGQNLQDHLLMPVIFKSRQEQPVPTVLAEAGLLVRTRAGLQAAAPDLQINFNATIPTLLPSDYPKDGGPSFTFITILVRPQSIGEVTLRSGDFRDAPLIRAHYLECETDLQVQVEAIKLCRRLAKTRAMAPFYKEEALPGADQSEEELRQYVRNHASTIWHPVGSCKMGRDRMAVVDPQLRVYGVKGLRVADASIMPAIVSSNPNAACFMIGEKAADMIKAACG